MALAWRKATLRQRVWWKFLIRQIERSVVGSAVSSRPSAGWHWVDTGFSSPSQAGSTRPSWAHGLARLAPSAGFELALGRVNHGLRGAESEADAKGVEALAGRLGLRCATRRADPRPLREGVSSRTRLTLQEAARELRYAALDAMAHECGADRIATAHTADDQAETVLLRLLRGCGPDGLAGIPERSADGRIVRPLLRVTRREIQAHAIRRRLRWREDASNRRSDYARNRLRNEWLPGLARDFNPRLLRAIGNLAEAQRRDSEWIRQQVEGRAAEWFTREGAWLRIEARGWSELPEALARRLVREALGVCGAGREASRVHIERALAFLREGRIGRRIELPPGLVLVRDRSGFRLGPLREVSC